jgi:hypothetical protein
MMDFSHDAKATRIATIVFAFLTGITAVSAAIVPALAHI